MTTFNQREILKRWISTRLGGQGEPFTVYAEREEVIVQYPAETCLGRTRYATARVTRWFDERKRITTDDLFEILRAVRDEFQAGMRDPRFTEQAREDCRLAYLRMEQIENDFPE